MVMKPIIKASVIAVAISLLPFGVQAAGLGQSTVRSKLGQALDVEIQVNASQQELQSLSARIASSDSFTQANVPYASFVPNVRVTVENRGDRSVLKLRTDTPVNETVANLIVQLNWDEGRVTRTYSFLLDPPELAIRPPISVAATPPPPVVESLPPQPPPEPPAVQAQAPVSVPAPAPVPTPAPAPAPDLDSGPTPGPTLELDLGDDPVPMNYESRREPELVVESDPEVLVASPPPPPQPVEQTFPMPPPDPVQEQLPVPDYTAQPSNYTVKSGDTLGGIARRNMPVSATPEQMMMALYRANQAAFINNNINRLRSGSILKIPTASDAQSTSHDEARKEVRIHAREFNEWRQQLAASVPSRTTSAAEDSPGGVRSIDAVPPPAELDRDRVVIATGDSSPGTNAQLQRLQEELATSQSAQKEAEDRAKELLEIVKLQNEATDLKGQSAPVTTAEATPPPAPPEQTPAPADEGQVAAVPAPQEPVEPKIETAQVAEPKDGGLPVDNEAFQDPLMEALSNPQVLGGSALILVLLAGFFGFRSWRSKRSDIGMDTLSQEVTSMFPDETTSFFGDNGGQSVDTTASSVINTDFSQTGLSIDTNEGVDPVAEADVYMAYGRDSQAEEILNDALKVDPKRGAIYVKLLEIYAQRQDLKQFEATASELLARTEGHGRDWEKAAQMGRRLDPSNPLYSASTSKREGGTVASKLPGLEPALEEPSVLDMGDLTGPIAATGSGTALSDLDFGTSSAMKSPAANAVQQTEEMQEHDTPSMQVPPAQVSIAQVPPASDGKTQAKADDDTTKVDFQFEPAETAPKAAGSLDFDLGKSRTTSETGKQPISVTVSRQSASPAGTASRKIGIRTTVSPKAPKDLAGPLDFDVSAQGRDVSANMTDTVVLPSMRDGNAHGNEVALDLEKSSFDPNALDFDLDLDLKSDTASKASITPKEPKGKARPIADPIDALNAGEIDTKLELALAYRDMGDNEGALELLREVVAQGNAAQKAEAKALIANLG